MGKRRTINEKRLTKKQVQELIRTEGKLHEGLTKTFEETYANGELKRDLIYELPGDRFLRVFAENDISLPGRGDIYPKDYMEKFAAWYVRLKDDSAHGRTSSVSHWWYYSRHRSDLLENIGGLISSLAELLRIEPYRLDSSYASLDLVSVGCGNMKLQDVYERCYDSLVAYVGEVIRLRVNGHWAMAPVPYAPSYPYISVGLKNVQYMPINAVWQALQGIDPIDLRKAAADEVRFVGPKAKFQREYGHLFQGKHGQ